MYLYGATFESHEGGIVSYTMPHGFTRHRSLSLDELSRCVRHDALVFGAKEWASEVDADAFALDRAHAPSRSVAHSINPKRRPR